MANAILNAANKAKNDEFYTQISDIEKKFSHYEGHFKGKIIFCNCDGPDTSNFWRYFHINFSHLGLKKILFFLVLLLVITGNGFTRQLDPEDRGIIRPEGFIPDEKTAMRVVEAIWLPMYGKKILKKKPYKATLMDGKTWLVEGTIRRLFAMRGGTRFIEIDKYSGAILKAAHTNMDQIAPEFEGTTPPEGFIPDEKTAMRVAEAVWLPIYGKEVLRDKPYEVTLIDGKTWLVEGDTRPFFLPRGGGGPYIEIDKYSGAILKVTHFK
ncbi:MAG: hypothetical protein LBD48_10460 [Treponema sp.]|jgi:hypothetical protein|nr:hypothetical protein [Treponema sp.]